MVEDERGFNFMKWIQLHDGYGNEVLVNPDLIGIFQKDECSNPTSTWCFSTSVFVQGIRFVFRESVAEIEAKLMEQE